MDTIGALLLHNHVPKFLQGEAVLHMIHLINQVLANNLSYLSPLDILLENYKYDGELF